MTSDGTDFYLWREILEENWETEYGSPKYVIARMLGAGMELSKDCIEE